MTTKLKPTCDTDPIGASDQIDGTTKLAALAFDHPHASDEELDEACDRALSDCSDPISIAKPTQKRRTDSGRS